MDSPQSRQNIYTAKLSDCGATFLNMDSFHPPIPARFPYHLKRERTEELTPQIIQQQEALALTFWEAFQILGYRLDCFEERIREIQDRLWKLEHEQSS